MTDLQTEIYQGEDAKMILESKIFKDFRRIFESGLRDKRLHHREDALAVQILAMQEGAYFDFVALLEEYISTGKMARIQVDE